MASINLDHTRLTREQEVELVRQYQAGDQDAAVTLRKLRKMLISGEFWGIEMLTDQILLDGGENDVDAS